MSAKILLINGPNLNLLGTREPELYGGASLADIEEQVKAYFEESGMTCLCFQSNHEGAIIDFIQAEGPSAEHAIINAGALTHTSIGLRDAISGVRLRFIELHISNVYAREPFRHHSYLSDVAEGVIAGLGPQGYLTAAAHIAALLGE